MFVEFRTRTRLEWKAFEIVNADENIMADFLSPNKLETALLTVMEAKVRLPCIVCQSHGGVIYCSITYTSSLQTKERIGHMKFLPIFYCVFYPCESVFYTTRIMVPDLVASAFIQAFGGTKLNKLPLEGRDFLSLRQLNHNRMHKGVLFRRPVQDTHPAYFEVESSQSIKNGNSNIRKARHTLLKILLALVEVDVIHDEDEPWKKRKNDYYNKHFDPASDPKLSKLTISVKPSHFDNSRQLIFNSVLPVLVEVHRFKSSESPPVRIESNAAL